MEDIRLFSGFTLTQDEKYFKLGLDSVLLSSFCTLKPNIKVMDVGAGIGTIPLLLLSRRRDISVAAVEINEGAAALCRENAEKNGLSDDISVINADIRKKFELPFGRCDLVVTNPPYFKSGSGKKARGGARQLSRYEDECAIDELVLASSKKMNFGGYFACVYRPERICDLICAMKSANIEPKRMRFVQNDALSAPSLVLLEGILGASAGVNIHPPLVLTENGLESREIKSIYSCGKMKF